MKIIIFLLLLLGCCFLFWENRVPEMAGEWLEKTKWGIDAASRQRALESRGNDAAKGLHWGRFLERELYYSGVKLRFPKLTAEYWATLNLAMYAGLMLITSFWGMVWGVIGVAALAMVEWAAFAWMKWLNMKSVNEQLLKFLDFLGNYSITSGEVTGVLFQVSRYMKEPLKSVLEECCYEAQTTGNVSEALLNMGEKVEHPKFRELVGNMEVGIRYCADFGMLISGSKRSVREYLKNSGDRKGMLREAVINMALLLGMSLFILMTVGNLVQASVSELLLLTLPGRIGLGVIAMVGILFLLQLKKIHY